MIIEFLGHAAFLVSARQPPLRILFDPYESGGFGGRVGYAPITEAVDVVAITHDHLDHCHTASLPPGFVTVRHEGAGEGWRLRSHRAAHDRFGGSRFGGFVDMKLLELEGRRLLHAGDLGESLGEPYDVEALRGLDVLILPVGGYYTLDAAGALELVERLQPKHVIPCHYKTPSCGFDIAPVEPFIEGFVERWGGAQLLRLEGSAFTLSESAAQPRCVWLQPRLDLAGA
jgi:L-ascorbate metabolism protein UlaG (beta-lactamase superfamily)